MKGDSVNKSGIQLSAQYKNFLSKIFPLILNLKAKRRMFFLVNGTVFIAMLIYLLFLAEPYYKSSVKILPEYGAQSTSMLSQISGIASFAGVNLGETSPAEIYESMVYAESVLSPVIFHKYITKKFPEGSDLIEYFEIDPDEDLDFEMRKRKRFLDALKILTVSKISTQVERVTRILTITVRMPEAQLSADVANGIVESLNNFINTQKKSFASEERKYLEKRIIEVRDSLSLAENNLKTFREMNRDVRNSPELLLELDRLQRAVRIKETVYIELVKQFELIKLDETKDTPAINIQEFANNPIKKDGPKRALILILTMIFSSIISGVVIIVYPFLRESVKFWQSS